LAENVFVRHQISVALRRVPPGYTSINAVVTALVIVEEIAQRWSQLLQR
jgi:hypothetical protein